MHLYVIGDLHLALGCPEKKMDIFKGWASHQEILAQNWKQLISEEDTVVLAGDFCWAMNLEDGLKDFQFIDALPGKKILLKGNHDYWWGTLNKIETFFQAHKIKSFSVLHNNFYPFGSYGICGSRGWVNIDQEKAENAKIITREAQRLGVSLKACRDAGLEPIAFLHYPPIFQQARNHEIMEVLHQYDVKRCYYGHLHGPSHRYALIGENEGIYFQLISGDYLQFKPEIVE